MASRNCINESSFSSFSSFLSHGLGGGHFVYLVRYLASEKQHQYSVYAVQGKVTTRARITVD